MLKRMSRPFIEEMASSENGETIDEIKEPLKKSEKRICSKISSGSAVKKSSK